MFVACKDRGSSVERTSESGIRHLVFFDLVDSLGQQELDNFFMALRDLEHIESVQSYMYGPYEEMDDPRSMRQYDAMLEMTFLSKEDYLAYQKDSIHLALKQNVAKMLKGAPVSYDFKLK